MSIQEMFPGAPFTRVLVLDYETAWCSKTYTLSKMTTEEYIRDRRFKAWGLCLKDLGSSEPAVWVGKNEAHAYLHEVDWGTTAVLAHNAQFDVAILEWRYDVHPVFILDSLSMARALYGTEVGNSLAKLAERFGLPPKGKAVHSTDGILTGNLSSEVEQELADYCQHDTWLCEQIFLRMLPGFPMKELRLIDMTLRMYTQPQLEIDASLLGPAVKEEQEKREGLLARLNVDEKELSSNPKFAKILEGLGVQVPMKKKKPTKKTPNPVGLTYAFAKNDALFQAMLNGTREDIALLCEARLKVKSTLERTRAQRFIDIAARGTLPVPLAYYGAHTGRWAASKGSALNMQNMGRGSVLRDAIMAPDGYVIVVGDLSQIEPRVLAWLADYNDMLAIFRSGADPYASFGAQMFGIPGLTKESHALLRQSAKSALLGCFGADTLVLTQRGWVPIVLVRATDMVWDGEEWVCHQGVKAQGEKEVLTAHGISATSDHEILTEHGWVEWCAVLADPSLLERATFLVNLPALGGNAARPDPNGSANQDTNQKCAVRAGGRGLSSVPTFGVDAPQGATTARRKKQQPREWPKQGTMPFAPTGSTATAYLTASAQSSSVAPTLAALHTRITEGVVSLCGALGLRTVQPSCSILSTSTDGTNRNCSLTASTTTKDTYPETCASRHAAKTWPTSVALLQEKSKTSSAESAPLKQRMQTYDIAYAGPRNRYTILTSEGPLIVHNCGYGLGWASFAAQLLTGFLGAPPVQYDKAMAKQLGVNSMHITRFLDWKENLRRMEEIPHTCTAEELLVHCLAAKAIIDKYRAAAAPVVALWELLQQLIQTSLYEGREYTYKGLVFSKEKILLPNGMRLKYDGLKIDKQDEKGRIQWVYGKDNKKVYGGLLAENITQALARIVMTDGMLRTQRRYPVKGTVHDEQIALAPEEEAQFARGWVGQQMSIAPKWMEGVPISAGVGAHKRYGKAKD